MKKEVVGGATGHFEGCSSCVAPWRKCVGHTRLAIENQEVLQRYWSMEHKRNVIGRAILGVDCMFCRLIVEHDRKQVM